MNDHSEQLPHIPGYDITRRLGRGGMADVFLGIQSSLSRPVAIKVLAVERTQGEDTVTRFEQEALTIARLDHPNIVSIFDVGRTGDGRLYYVMPYLPNGDLSTRDLRDDEAQVVAIIRSLARALGYAHKLGIIHRDVKPENVLFDKLDRPLLADFGIALAAEGFARVTREGSTIGSSGYMSPEQSRGFAIDGRADLYSLGVVAYEMLSGELPYKGPDTLAVALAHVEQPIPRLPPRRRRWQAFIDKAMAKSPDERFQTASQMESALDAVAGQIGGKPEAAYDTKPLPSLSAPSPASGWRAHSGLLLTVALIIAGAAMIAYAVRRLQHPPPALVAAGNVDPAAKAADAARTPASAAPASAAAPGAAATPDASASHGETSTAPAAAPPVGGPASDAAPAPAPVSPRPHLADLAAGAPLRDRSGPELVFVPGKFARDGKTVDIGNGFALARYEVTRRDYAAFVAATGRDASKCREPHSPLSLLRKLSWREPGFSQDDSHPVVCVSWTDADAYVKWLAARTHARYRLPTHAEWAHAALWSRSGSGNCARGNLLDDKRALLAKDTDKGCSDGFEYTAAVGKFKPNRLGIHDLVGNVSEWTSDCKGAGKNSGAGCKEHMFSGNSWRDEATRAPDYQDDAGSDVGYTTIGLRVLRELDDDNIPVPGK